MTCEYCDDTGIEPCANCSERDCGLSGDDMPCHIDGVTYGAGACRRGCPVELVVDADAVLGDAAVGIDALHEALDAVTEGTLADQGTRLALAEHLLAQLKVIKAGLETALIEAMPEDTMSMNGVVVQREKVTRSTWKPSGAARLREDLRHAVATKLATDVETGEVNVGRRNLIETAIRELYAVIPSFSNVLVTGRDRYGIQMSRYRDYTTGYNVSVHEEGTTA